MRLQRTVSLSRQYLLLRRTLGQRRQSWTSELVTRAAPEIGDKAHDLPLILSLLLALDMRISASLPISAQMLHLGVVSPGFGSGRVAVGRRGSCARPGTAQCTAHARHMQSRGRKDHDLQ